MFHFYSKLAVFTALLSMSSVGYASNETSSPEMGRGDDFKGNLFFERNYGQLKTNEGLSAESVFYYANTPEFSWYLT